MHAAVLAVPALVAFVACTDTEPRPAVRRIVFVAGTPSHGPGEHEYFAGLTLLAKMVAQTPNVETAIARGGFPPDPTFFDGASAIVVFADGGGGHPLLDPDRAAFIDRAIDRGVGFACLHWAVEFVAREEARALRWLGGYYLDGVSVNPVWTPSFVVAPHAITGGVGPFALRDEWYFRIRFVDSPAVTPLLRAIPPEDLAPGAKAETTAWAFERPNGGRSFGYTGGHFHSNWGDPSVRSLVTNALLWIAHAEVPAAGAPVDMDPAMLRENLDAK